MRYGGPSVLGVSPSAHFHGEIRRRTVGGVGATLFIAIVAGHYPAIRGAWLAQSEAPRRRTQPGSRRAL
ncbi:MAG TPA: hypothetical protein VHC49_00530 [Mycobacteriales bacterium]|nr:hypothetical protein [Mycobacteriales bacterium]